MREDYNLRGIKYSSLYSSCDGPTFLRSAGSRGKLPSKLGASAEEFQGVEVELSHWAKHVVWFMIERDEVFMVNVDV